MRRGRDWGGLNIQRSFVWWHVWRSRWVMGISSGRRLIDHLRIMVQISHRIFQNLIFGNRR